MCCGTCSPPPTLSFPNLTTLKLCWSQMVACFGCLVLLCARRMIFNSTGCEKLIVMLNPRGHKIYLGSQVGKKCWLLQILASLTAYGSGAMSTMWNGSGKKEDTKLTDSTETWQDNVFSEKFGTLSCSPLFIVHIN